MKFEIKLLQGSHQDDKGQIVKAGGTFVSSAPLHKIEPDRYAMVSVIEEAEVVAARKQVEERQLAEKKAQKEAAAKAALEKEMEELTEEEIKTEEKAEEDAPAPKKPIRRRRSSK